MLKLWRMQSILSLPSLPGPLRLGVVAPVRVQSNGSNRAKIRAYAKISMFQMELFLYAKRN